ncbi:MAG TPA: type II secretion system protein N, partial [Burkholderiaceae bacterium]|nr:type II secretion system protein N [Burkholderiaceae bacterium]
VATIEQGNLWGKVGGAMIPLDEKPLTAPNWRIIGVVSAGKESYALVAVDGQPMQQIKVGEKLPGDIKIVNMTADHVCILLNGKKRVLKTYKE